MKINDKYLIRQERDFLQIKDVLEKRKLSGTSDIIEQYEQSLASYWGTKYALAVSSGTTAIHTALHSIGIKEKDEIIITALAPIMSALPVIQMEAIPVFADCQTDNFDFDYSKLESYISAKTKAIMAVPIYGYPFDYEKLSDICKKHNLYFIEDAAQAHGAKYKGKMLGSFGDISCFSTHDRKILSTGEGGFILTNNEQLKDSTKAFIQFDNMSGVNWGTNYKLSSLQAAIGISRTEQINSQLEVRKKNVELFFEYLNGTDKVENISIPEFGVPNYYGLVLKISEEIEPIKFINYLNALGIPSDILKYKFVPLYRREIFSKYSSDCQNAEKICKQTTTIPVHPDITSEQIEYMANAILKYQQ